MHLPQVGSMKCQCCTMLMKLLLKATPACQMESKLVHRPSVQWMNSLCRTLSMQMLDMRKLWHLSERKLQLMRAYREKNHPRELLTQTWSIVETGYQQEINILLQLRMQWRKPLCRELLMQMLCSLDQFLTVAQRMEVRTSGIGIQETKLTRAREMTPKIFLQEHRRLVHSCRGGKLLRTRTVMHGKLKVSFRSFKRLYLI
mmetsp:Transcript_1724/g.2687  ORF Transcript_1724/g.2687 Transcript_1724/m.2687 type:complete len:201 (+) Transcript_1724:41-643(+)